MFGISLSAKVISYLLGGIAVIGSYAGVGFYCYHKGASESKTVIAQYQADNAIKAQTVQTQVQKSNDNVVVKYVDRDKVITQYRTVYVKATDALPKTANLSNGWLNLHDAAVNETQIPASAVNDANDSGYSQGDALNTVITNYSTCKGIRNQLVQLQESITNNNAIISKK